MNTKQNKQDKANINYSVQGIRGGAPHKKNNVGSVTAEVDNGLTIECDAFTTSLDTNERMRRKETLITIKKDEDIVFCSTPSILVDVLQEYYGIDVEKDC